MTASVYEKAVFEVSQARNELAMRLAPFVSRDWILRNVLKLTDDEISRRSPLDDFVRQVFEGA